MNKIDELTQRLAAQEPELKNADALLESIMSRIDEVEQLPPLNIDQQPQRQKESLWLSLTRWSSSIAAMLLLALFISQRIAVENPDAGADYSRVLSAYQPDYSALKQASTTSEAFNIITREKSNRMGISELKRQFITARQ